MPRGAQRLNIAIVGTGIAGLSAAWLLSKAHRLTRTTMLGWRKPSAERCQRGCTIAFNTGSAAIRCVAASGTLSSITTSATFYAVWLDPAMSFSSALYRRPEITMEEAQAAKLKRVLELLPLDGGDSVIELGCGWGGPAIRLAQGGAPCHTFGARFLRRAMRSPRSASRPGSGDSGTTISPIARPDFAPASSMQE